MVSVDNEIFDDLPYTDDIVTPEELERTRHLVEDELDNMRESGVIQNDNLHPSIENTLPLSNNVEVPLLMKEIERYEEEPDMDVEDGLIQGGIDLSRYSDFGNDGEIDYRNLDVTSSYASLYQRNLDLSIENVAQLKNLQEKHLQSLGKTKDQYTQSLHCKRNNLDTLNESRRKKQLVDFQPVNDYLNSRWKEGIKSLVDMGVEASRLDMDLN